MKGSKNKIPYYYLIFLNKHQTVSPPPPAPHTTIIIPNLAQGKLQLGALDLAPGPSAKFSKAEETAAFKLSM